MPTQAIVLHLWLDCDAHVLGKMMIIVENSGLLNALCTVIPEILTGMPTAHALAAAPVAVSGRLAVLLYAPVASAATSQPGGQSTSDEVRSRQRAPSVQSAAQISIMIVN